MKQTSAYSNFDEFWPFYLGEHKNKKSRALHYFGTILSHLLLVLILLQQTWWLLPLVLIVGYLPAWIGHFVIEKNRPATFKHPLWSLRGDYKMLYLAATGRLSKELNR